MTDAINLGLSNGTTARVFYNGHYREYQVDIMTGDIPVACVGWYQTKEDALIALVFYADRRGLKFKKL